MTVCDPSSVDERFDISHAAHQKGKSAAVGFLGIDENIQKLIKKTVRIFDPFSIVNLNAFIDLDK